MTNVGIKKVTVLNEDLPIINNAIGGYGVRYRIVSEDRNRISHWSPVYFLNANYTYVPGQIKFSKNTGLVNITWDRVEVKKGSVSIGKIRDYEIWLKWGKSGAGDWIYYGKVQSNSLSLIVPDSYSIDGITSSQTQNPNQLTVEVFLEGIPVSRTDTSLRMYNPATETV